MPEMSKLVDWWLFQCLTKNSGKSIYWSGYIIKNSHKSWKYWSKEQNKHGKLIVSIEVNHDENFLWEFLIM